MSAGATIADFRQALVDEGLAPDVIASVLARVERSEMSPRDRRDQLIVAIAADFFSQATSVRQVADALSFDVTFPSWPRWKVAPERRAAYRARLREVAEICSEASVAAPSADTMRRILDGSRTPGKRQKTERFRLAHFLSVK